MDGTVKLEHIPTRLLAAVRRTAAPRAIPAAVKPALDLVWAFLREHQGLRADGHNVFLYHHVARPEAGMPIDFGVEVTRRFEAQAEVRCIETPPGEAAVTVHRGPYHELPRAHAALHAWCASSGREIGAGILSNSPDPRQRRLPYSLHLMRQRRTVGGAPPMFVFFSASPRPSKDRSTSKGGEAV